MKAMQQVKCSECKNDEKLSFDISMAFQPIVNLHTFSVYGYEALVRGTEGQGAAEVFKNVDQSNLYKFDQTCRTTAIALASKLKLDRHLSINFMPNAVYEPARCIQSTLSAANKYNFPLDLIVFEFTESEKLIDEAHVCNIVHDYQKRGFLTAIDDFGAGYSGLNLLCNVDVDIVKIDRLIIKDIHEDPRRQRILRGVFDLLKPVTKRIVVEGVESLDELKFLYSTGFRYFQGYYFARPGFEMLPQVDFHSIRKALGEKRIHTRNIDI